MELPEWAALTVEVKTVWFTFEISKLQELLTGWDQQFGCQLREESGSIVLTLGKEREIQLVLKGRKKRKFVIFYSGEILGHRIDEETLFELLGWICNVQNGSKDDALGLIISRDGHHSHPLFIQNGVFYDEASMMDFLWGHYTATRVRESRRMEEAYHFLRDAPKLILLSFFCDFSGAVGDFLLL